MNSFARAFWVATTKVREWRAYAAMKIFNALAANRNANVVFARRWCCWQNIRRMIERLAQMIEIETAGIFTFAPDDAASQIPIRTFKNFPLEEYAFLPIAVLVQRLQTILRAADIRHCSFPRIC